MLPEIKDLDEEISVCRSLLMRWNNHQLGLPDNTGKRLLRLFDLLLIEISKKQLTILQMEEKLKEYSEDQ